jgi:hypothetical protein
LKIFTALIIAASFARDPARGSRRESRRAWAAQEVVTIAAVSQASRLAVDRYVIETLLPDLVGHDRRASSFLVYLVLWAKAGEPGRKVRLSLRTLAEETGLSKRGVQSGLANLARRRLVSIHRASITAVPEYAVTRPWIRG